VRAGGKGIRIVIIRVLSSDRPETVRGKAGTQKPENPEKRWFFLGRACRCEDGKDPLMKKEKEMEGGNVPQGGKT